MHASAHDLIPLALLAAGGLARIAQVLGSGAQVQRLQELGLRNGVEIEMVQPGSPCILRIGGQKLCLRVEELSTVLVTTISGHAA